MFASLATCRSDLLKHLSTERVSGALFYKFLERLSEPKIHLTHAQGGVLNPLLSLFAPTFAPLSFYLRSALFRSPRLKRDSNCTINPCSVLTEERRLALGQLNSDVLDYGGFKRSNNQKPFQRLANKQNHLPTTHLCFHNSITCWHCSTDAAPVAEVLSWQFSLSS